MSVIPFKFVIESVTTYENDGAGVGALIGLVAGRRCLPLFLWVARMTAGSHRICEHKHSSPKMFLLLGRLGDRCLQGRHHQVYFCIPNHKRRTDTDDVPDITRAARV